MPPRNPRPKFAVARLPFKRGGGRKTRRKGQSRGKERQKGRREKGKGRRVDPLL